MTQQEMEAIWAEHIRHEFVTRDVEATLATMVEDASVIYWDQATVLRQTGLLKD